MKYHCVLKHTRLFTAALSPNHHQVPSSSFRPLKEQHFSAALASLTQFNYYVCRHLCKPLSSAEVCLTKHSASQPSAPHLSHCLGWLRPKNGLTKQLPEVI